jgi:cytochrome c-type biogenesis protein CcmH
MSSIVITKRFLITVLSSVVVTFVVVSSFGMLVQAQGSDYDRINVIAEQLNCPTCTGINLADCRTQTCTQWKEQIKDLLDQGKSDQEVLDYFVAQYGTQVLQEPPKAGFTLSLWVLPVIMIVVGGGLLFVTMRKWTNANRPEPVEATEVASTTSTKQRSTSSDDYLRQVDRDLGLE